MSRRMVVRMDFYDSRNTLKKLATPAGLEPATCRLEGGGTWDKSAKRSGKIGLAKPLIWLKYRAALARV
jgi:hypothetical protein